MPRNDDDALLSAAGEAAKSIVEKRCDGPVDMILIRLMIVEGYMQGFRAGKEGAGGR